MSSLTSIVGMSLGCAMLTFSTCNRTVKLDDMSLSAAIERKHDRNLPWLALSVNSSRVLVYRVHDSRIWHVRRGGQWFVYNIQKKALSRRAPADADRVENVLPDQRLTISQGHECWFDCDLLFSRTPTYSAVILGSSEHLFLNYSAISDDEKYAIRSQIPVGEFKVESAANSLHELKQNPQVSH